MFKTRRASLLRRLWRSRELSDSSARDGATQAQDTRRGPCGTQRPVTRAEPGDVTESDDRDEEQSVGPGAMCVQRRVTCCLLGDCCLRGPTRDQAGPESADRGLSGATYGFLKKLTEQSLETLVRAVESSGGAPGDCVVVPGQELRPGPGPHFVMCRTFRWCELRPRDTLKALCFCQSHGAAHGTNVCCNPYHYSRVCEPDSPPPPYSLSHSQEHKPAPAVYAPMAPHSGAGIAMVMMRWGRDHMGTTWGPHGDHMGLGALSRLSMAGVNLLGSRATF
ncbi:mothers against decapentaplegic homolog 6-like [Eucyclogobius newberryi]|uniref:mothers against decapentaplegic homolog 6-like n=1 Tax=Eucyclogobius newberryi TaxID=166745 RepID=UPI003B5A9F4C